MPIRKKPWTPAEIERAKKLYERHRVAGTLKPGRALGAVAGLSGGPIRSFSSSCTWKDYLQEARDNPFDD